MAAAGAMLQRQLCFQAGPGPWRSNQPLLPAGRPELRFAAK